MWGIGAAFVLFLAWALGRELDPDHDLSAFVGAALAVAGLLAFGMPSLILILWLLLALRVVNRTVGLPARPLDTLGVLGLGLWLSWQGNWLVGVITAVIFLLDGLLAQPLRYHLAVAGLALVAAVGLGLAQGAIAVESGLTVPLALATVVMSALFVIVIATTRPVTTICDATAAPLVAARVQAAQSLALVLALLAAWLQGPPGMLALMPLWAAMTGAGLYRLGYLLLLRRK
jgi:hypothetical protein